MIKKSAFTRHINSTQNNGKSSKDDIRECVLGDNDDVSTTESPRDHDHGVPSSHSVETPPDTTAVPGAGSDSLPSNDNSKFPSNTYTNLSDYRPEAAILPPDNTSRPIDSVTDFPGATPLPDTNAILSNDGARAPHTNTHSPTHRKTRPSGTGATPVVDNVNHGPSQRNTPPSEWSNFSSPSPPSSRADNLDSPKLPTVPSVRT